MSAKNLTRREFFRLSGVTSLGLVAAACGASSGAPSASSASPPPASGGAAPAASAGTSTKPSAAASQQAQGAAQSSTLTSAVSSFSDDTLDPMLSGAVNHGTLIYPMYDPLVGNDAKGQLVPVVAESWSLSPDGKVWTLKIRKGIKFHNGDELTSADVKFSLERTLSPASRTAFVPTLRPVIDKIETPDPSTVTVTTKSVTVTFIDLLTGGVVVMPMKYLQAKGDAEFAKNPVGSGPFKFVSHTPGSSVEFAAVPNHWRIQPAFQKLVIKLVPEESTRMAMLKRGEADVIEISLDRVDELKAGGFQTRTAGYDSQPVMYLGGTWVGTDMPTQNLQVRQAMALAIDREELGKTFFKGYATPARRVKLGPSSYGWDSSWTPEPHDPQKAKQLLSEAGYPGKFKEPVITMWSHQAQAFIPQFVQIVSGYWEAVGIKTKITPIDFAQMRKMYIAKPVDPKIVGTAYPFNEGAQANPLMSIVNAYGSKGVNSNLNDAAWDNLYAQIMRERDNARRLQMTRQLMTDGYNHYSIILTVNVNNIWGVGNKVGEWRPDFIQTGLAAVYAGMQRK